MKTNFYRYSLKNGWRELQKDIGRGTAMLMFSGVFMANVLGGALAQTITLKEQKASLHQVLEKIRKQANVDLIGDIALLRGTKPLTIDVKNTDLKTVLKEISLNQPVELSFQNNTIIVKEKASTQVKAMDNARSAQQMAIQQEYSLVGTVTDEKGKPLKGVTVKLLNSGNWASTTADDGTYAVRVTKDAEVLFSILGYEPRTLKVNGRNHLDVVLKMKDNEIEEVTVSTGYGLRKKESMTGASTTITRKELEKFNNNNIFSTIQSIDPAFKIANDVNVGSNPNALPEITVRGTNSVGEYAVNAPLVILDGFEVPLERLYDLDVNRIESISILKDASTTVLYGSRGGNGVIIVETRLPKDGKFTVTYDLKPSLTVVDLSDYSLMNAQQKLDYERAAGVYKYTASDEPYNNNINQTDLDNILAQNQRNVLKGVDTYWLSQPVKSTLSLGHNIRVEGGGDDVRYSVDANYNDFKGAMKGSGRKRAGAGFNLIYRIPQKITFRNNATFQQTNAYNSPYGNFSLYTRMNPYQPIHDDDGELIPIYKNEFEEEVRYNPVYDASLTHRNQEVTTVLTDNFSLEWYINPNLILNSKAVLEKTFVKGEVYTSPFHSGFLEKPVNERGSYKLLNGDGLSYYANLQLTYARVMGDHAVNGSVVGEINSSDMSTTSHILTGFTADRYVSPSLALQYALNSRPEYAQVPSRLVGAVATGNYTYRQKYILDLSYRMDGSSKFGKNNRYGNFWSAGVGYNLHKEKFFKNDFINELRLFANTGVNGADNFSAKMTSTSYILNSNNIYFKEIGLAYNNEGNTDLRWPKIRSTSIGISGRLWDSRLSFTFSAYDKTTDKMISLITVAPSLGVAGNAYFENMGKTQNKGFESSLSVKAYENSSKTFNWFVSGSIVKNQSKLLNISDALKQLNENNMKTKNDPDFEGDTKNLEYFQTVYYQQGESLDNIKGVRSLGIDPASGREVYLDRNGNRTYDWDAKNMTIIGNKEPKLFGTLNTTINYKSFSLQAYFNYTLGGDVYNQTLIDKIENINPKMNADVRALHDRWQAPGDIALFKDIKDQKKTLLTSRFVQQENYLRFSTLNINYDLPRDIVRKYRLERFRVNVSMNDVFRWSTVKMERGIDYPYARTFNVGLMAQF
ncbi:SusC/RagA family TonB-linked outer membrane protein [Sphingobacterium yanglingense]|uniref:TonB-linked SusC/RagA family outer membrane protein n=1 Tax=Sphingobacterium yanglingense TaxID=1437280 RepID=A0A4R6WCH1_9SPHI|nr:SusC/RagA family TonB-linked outer membrane protein [Sphingobacterium yanglingense]TDQ75444.1 TonB-linked SusC/RagA family outer membrane protein [Sphingobacterium yanglingense]